MTHRIELIKNTLKSIREYVPNGNFSCNKSLTKQHPCGIDLTRKYYSTPSTVYGLLVKLVYGKYVEVVESLDNRAKLYKLTLKGESLLNELEELKNDKPPHKREYIANVLKAIYDYEPKKGNKHSRKRSRQHPCGLDLAKLCTMTPPTIYQLLNKLCYGEYIEILKGPDGRVKEVYKITKKGKSLLNELEELQNVFSTFAQANST